MKKAREYADEILAAYVNTDEKGAIDKAAEVVKAMFSESLQLYESRKGMSTNSYIAILLELDLKWRAICRRVNSEIDILHDLAFRIAIFQVLPKDIKYRILNKVFDKVMMEGSEPIPLDEETIRNLNL